MSAKEFAYRIKWLTQFAFKKQIYLIADNISLRESNLLSQQKLLICWIADRTYFHLCLCRISFLRQITESNSLTKSLLNCWHDLLTDNKFAEFCWHHKFLYRLCWHHRYALDFAEWKTFSAWMSDGSKTTFLKFSHHANLSTAGAQSWQIRFNGWRLECASAGPSCRQ
jgi:hypothetical protein